MSMQNIGKWTDEETAAWVQDVLSGNGPVTPEDFRKTSPYHMPDYQSTVELGQAAPDGRVFELDGTETSLSAKLQTMGQCSGRLMVLNFGSYT